MAAYISFQPSDHYNTTLYTGNAGTLNVNGVGFESDMTWIKKRSGTSNHLVSDSVRGPTKQVYTNLPDSENSNVNEITDWDADGFDLGASSDVNDATTYFSHNWKMGTTSGIAGSPTITPSSYSFNATAGQSIIAYTGTGVAATLPHGLGVVPEYILVKRLGSADNWNVGQIHEHASTPWNYSMKFNNQVAPGASSTIWNDTAPDATVFSIGTSTEVNTNTSTYIAYCFAPKLGYSKFGAYVGSNASNGTFLYTGFRPAWLMIKRIDSPDSWISYDDKRLGYNDQNAFVECDNTGAELLNKEIDILSNGFKLRTNNVAVNNGTYIYMAFAEFPIVASNDVPGVAR